MTAAAQQTTQHKSVVAVVDVTNNVSMSCLGCSVSGSSGSDSAEYKVQKWWKNVELKDYTEAIALLFWLWCGGGYDAC